MKLTADESRALGFIALLIGLSVGARLLDRPEPIELDAAGVDVAELEAASRAALARRNAPPPPALGPGERIDPNTAAPEQLRRLPRMTATLAARIVEDRERRGPFRSIQDLDRVQGVGPATLAAWRDALSLPAASGATSPARSPGGTGPPEVAAGARDTRRTAVLDLNRATAQELERLPGVGPALAARIVARRDSIGGFRAVEELEKVRGIGPVLVEKLKPMVRVGT
jgi:competence protein ComEA